MSKHTPGPWRSDDETDGMKGAFHIPVWAAENTHRLAEVQPYFHTESGEFEFRDEDWANARLIAAAPEMFDALVEAKAVLLEDSRPVKARLEHAILLLDEAIAKTTGENNE